MEAAKVILLCVASASTYGVLHDQVTARVCVEYFTIGHSPVFGTQSPTLLALGWGILATWWVGLLLGVSAACACRAGAWPKCDAARLVRPIIGLMLVIGCASLIAGLAGHAAAEAGVVQLLEPLRSQVPTAKHARFLADLWAHSAAYAVGFAGGVFVCTWIVVGRRRKTRIA